MYFRPDLLGHVVKSLNLSVGREEAQEPKANDGRLWRFMTFRMTDGGMHFRVCFTFAGLQRMTGCDGYLYSSYCC